MRYTVVIPAYNEDGVLVETHKLLKAWAGAEAPAYDPFAEESARMKAAEAWKVWAERQ